MNDLLPMTKIRIKKCDELLDMWVLDITAVSGSAYTFVKFCPYCGKKLE